MHFLCEFLMFTLIHIVSYLWNTFADTQQPIFFFIAGVLLNVH